jgi:hypothetical protein
MYGRRKMTPYLRRQGHQVGIGTLDRLMRDEGMCGMVGGGQPMGAGPVGATPWLWCVATPSP